MKNMFINQHCSVLQRLQKTAVCSTGETRVQATSVARRMRHMAVSLLALLACVAGERSSWAAENYFYTPEAMGNITGRVLADPSIPQIPRKKLFMTTFGCTPYAASQVISSWQVGDYSGLLAPAPLGDYQRGIDNNWYGSTAMQVTNDAVGGQLHTYSIAGRSGYNNNLANMQAMYWWDDDVATMPAPWARNSKSKMHFKAKLKVPVSWIDPKPETWSPGLPCGYVYASFMLIDSLDPNPDVQQKKGLWYQVQFFDTRWAPSTEFCGWDVGTNKAWSNSYCKYKASTRYCTTSSNSSPSTGQTWNDAYRTFDFTVSRTQLTNVLNDVNAQFPSAQLPTNPARYKVLMMTIQNEIYYPTGDGHLGFTARDIYLSEMY